MKRTITCLLALLMVLAILPATAADAEFDLSPYSNEELRTLISEATAELNRREAEQAEGGQ